MAGPSSPNQLNISSFYFMQIGLEMVKKTTGDSNCPNTRFLPVYCLFFIYYAIPGNMLEPVVGLCLPFLQLTLFYSIDILCLCCEINQIKSNQKDMKLSIENLVLTLFE
jgi:hypothetical protein